MRLGLDEYFLELAKVTALRSTCPRAQVGAVAVNKQNIVIGTGYNGSPIGVDHCIDVGCEIEAGKCISCVHAEVNAILGCGPNIAGGTVYCTLRPCLACTQLLINARVSKVVYLDIRHKTFPYFEKVINQSGIIMMKFGGLK
jgi:dCMP deaminase